MVNSPIRVHLCKKCHKSFEHEEQIALFKQHQYHFHCFVCASCQKALSHDSFYLDEKFQLDISNPQVYCERCYFQRLSTCRKCQQTFTSTSIVIEFQGEDYHQECFICEQCQTMLRDDVFYTKDHSLFCQTCLTQREPCLLTLQSSLSSVESQCKKCAKHFRPGESIATYQSDVYHRDCFRCGHCAKALVSEGFFRQEDGCLYCLACHINHGPHCGICQEPFLTGEVLSQFDGKQFHHTCFLCETCQQPIDRKEFRYENTRVICEVCWKNTTQQSERPLSS